MLGEVERRPAGRRGRWTAACSTLRVSDSGVCSWAATVPVGTWCSSTRRVRPADIFHTQRRRRLAREVPASSSVEGTREVL